MSINDNDEHNESYTERLLQVPDESPKKKSSNVQAFVNTIKSFIGVGILEFPYAIKMSGLWAGIAALGLIGLASDFTIRTLIKCKDEIVDRQKSASSKVNPDVTFGDVGHYAFGTFGTFIVNFAIISSQLGFCCAYVVFIADNLNTFFPQISVMLFSLIYFPVFMLLSWLRNLRYLAPTSIFGNLALLFGASVIMYYGITHVHLEASYPILRPATFPTFFGIAVFGFEGINLALPIESSMQNPKQYGRLIDLSLLIVGFCYITFGALGYVLYGEAIAAEITTKNLPATALTAVVKVALITELTFSFPMQLFPVSTILETYLTPRGVDYREWKRTLLRTLLVAFTVGIAVLIPHFDLLSAFIGAFSNSLVTFIFPPVFYMIIFKGKLTSLDIFLNVVVLVLGVLASATSTTIAVKQIIAVF